MFEAEADGLNELRTAGEVRVPEVIDVGIENGQSYLVIEHLDLQRPSRDVERKFGQQLARLHRHTADRFGWFRDNTIGPTPQRNDWSDDWIDFFGELRLDFQVRLAARNGYDLTDEGARLRKRLPELFDAYEPVASLLHGDLWGGNWAALPDGTPVLFDPAVYHGDREADLAMTELFGGFDPAFHAAYREAAPLDPGYPVRRDLYNLYHVLNHVNLFGGGYAGQAQRLIDRLLAA